MNKKRTIILMLFTLLFCFIQAGADTGSLEADMDLSFLPEENFSMELANADVKNIIHIVGVTYNINFLVNETVTGTMTVNFKDVPIRDAFKSILKNFELNFTRDGNIIRIDNFSSLEKKKTNASLITRAINVQYTFDSTSSISGKGAGKSLTTLAKSLQKLLSDKEGAGISVITRTNTLLVTDIAEAVDRIEKLVGELDRKSKQIKIMARIIEATTDFTQQLGVSWGGVVDGTYEMNSRDKNIMARGAQVGTGLSGEKFAQDASSLVSPIAGGASIDLLLGKITSNFLDIQLSAMEEDDDGKILASPKVITQNNMPAMIKSGVKVPLQTIEEGTVTIKYEDALIQLDALPHIIDTGIFLDLKVIKDDVDSTRSIDGNPFLLNKEITTKVLVGDGETVVIGGLITQTDTNSVDGVPYLSRIPLLGWFFRYEKLRNQKTELLIFITPSILKR
jgi:type IV pilus assembly protein PilQ